MRWYITHTEAATGRCSVKKDVLKNKGLQISNFIKKRLQHRCFPVRFAHFLRTPILKNICEWLLLNIVKKFTKHIPNLLDFFINDCYAWIMSRFLVTECASVFVCTLIKFLLKLFPWAILKFRRRNDLRIKAYFRKNWIDTQPDVYCRAIYETLSTFSLWIHLNKSSFLFAIWKFLVSHFKLSFSQVLRIPVFCELNFPFHDELNIQRCKKCLNIEDPKQILHISDSSSVCFGTVSNKFAGI